MSPISRCLSLPILCTMLLACPSLNADDWTRFRGDNGTGISNLKGIPATWSPGDYEWNIEIDGVGHSSPIIVGDKLFVTSAVDEGAVRHLHCMSPRTGAVNWSRDIGLNRSHKHKKSSWASSTPTTDGERLFVAFADKEHYFFAAYDFDGTLLWRQNIGTFESQHGQGVSPVVYRDVVILPNDQKGPSSIVAFDRETGEVRWSALRSFRKTSYATPMILSREGKPDQLICASGAMGISSLDPSTGTLNWFTGEFPLRTVASPVWAGGTIVESCGGGGVGRLLIAVDPDGQGDVSETHIRYERKKVLPYVPTPVVHDGHIYLWNDNGVVSCVRISDWENLWTERVGGNYSGSPVCIDGRLYCMSEEGEVVVIDASPEYRLHGRTPLGDPSHATPAVADGRLFLRTFHRLMCLKAES